MAGVSPSPSTKDPYRTPSPTLAGTVEPEKTIQQLNKSIMSLGAILNSPRNLPKSHAVYNFGGSIPPSSYQGSPLSNQSVPSLSMTASSISTSLVNIEPTHFEEFDSIHFFDEFWEGAIQYSAISSHPKPTIAAPKFEHDLSQVAQQTAILPTTEDCTPHSDPPKTPPSCRPTGRSRLLLEECRLSTEQIPKYPLIASWLLQSERSVSSSESNSVGSLESDVTDDECAEADFLLYQEDNDIDIEPLNQGQVTLDLTAMCMHALLINDLPWNAVSRLYTTFMALVDSWMSTMAIFQCAADGGTPPVPSDASQAGSAPEHTQSSNGGRKRTLGDDDKELPGQDADNNRRKRQKLHGEIDARSRQKWACPYYQREPHRYCVETEFGDFRKCARSPGFDQVHRVKDHIYKCHSPKYCDRCYATFKEEEDLTNHRRMSPACDVKPPQQIEGLTSEQKKLLKPRDRRSKSDQERWETIYKICFPEDQVIPSAYYVHYSREIAELRREVFAIIEREARSPGPLDVNRMVQRLHGAFNNQFSTHNSAIIIPPTPEDLTPPTTNASNTSTGRSSQAPQREEYQETPSLRSASKRVAEATGVADNSDEPIGDESNEKAASSTANTSSPVWPLSATHIPENDNNSIFPPAPPIPLRDLLGQMEPFDFDSFIEQDDAAAAELNFSQPDLVNPYIGNTAEVTGTLGARQGISQGNM